MKWRFFIGIFLVFQNLIINLCWAQGVTHISFARTRIDGVQALGDPTLPYNQLLSQVLENIKDIDVNHGFYPTARGYFLFESKKVDCVFPGDPNNLTLSFDTLVSEPINLVNAYLFNFAEIALHPKDIQSKRLALIRGYVYGNNQQILQHNNVTTVQNSSSAMGMLKFGRVDAFADYYLDLSLNLPATELASLNYDQENPIASVTDYILCHSTPQNIDFINRINQVIRDMKQDGRLKNILGNYYGYND